MVCESCGSTIPDDASVCPECGVSTSLFLVKPALQTVIQTIPDFAKKSGSASDEKSNNVAVNKANTPAYISLFIGIAVMLFSIIVAINPNAPYELYFFVFAVLIIDLVVSFFGLAESKKNRKSKSLAIASLILCFVCIITYLLVMYFFVLPHAMESVLNSFSPRITDIGNEPGYNMKYF